MDSEISTGCDGDARVSNIGPSSTLAPTPCHDQSLIWSRLRGRLLRNWQSRFHFRSNSHRSAHYRPKPQFRLWPALSIFRTAMGIGKRFQRDRVQRFPQPDSRNNILHENRFIGCFHFETDFNKLDLSLSESKLRFITGKHDSISGHTRNGSQGSTVARHGPEHCR